MSLLAYPEYQDTGVEWLPRIPAHWTFDRLKRRCDVFPSNVDKKSKEGEATVQLCNYTDVYYNDVIRLGMPFMEATASEDQVSKFTLRAGDTIFTKDSETADDIGISAFVPADIDGVICGYHLSIARPRAEACGAFVKRLFDAAYTKAQFAVLANGLTRVGLNQYAVDNVVLPWPPLDEQALIVAFIDRETAKIDALIAEQEKLLTLLAEKRQATISHAVIRGLDPHSPMKDSGIPWLGEIPGHWNICLLKRAFASVDYGISDSLAPEGEIAVLRMGNIRNRKVSIDDLKYVDQVDDALLLRDGDLLFNRTNSIDLVGKVGLFDGCISTPISFASYLVRLRLAADHDARYFAYFLNMDGLLGLVRASAFVAIGQCNLNPTRYGEIRIAAPPLQEQQAIAAHLDEEVSSFDVLEAEADRAISLLRERRSALISAAITGKIDVRGLV